jgi:hypothetical protein
LRFIGTSTGTVTNSNKHHSLCIKPSTCPIVPVNFVCVLFIFLSSYFSWGGARDTGTIDMDKFRKSIWSSLMLN